MKINTSLILKIKKILKYVFAALGVLFVLYFFVLVYFGYKRYDDAKVAEQIEVIKNTHITLADVMGTNLPSDPGTEADKTVAGVDANKNGIRDDVELAIFKEYPNSAKTRAVLLQYALALQMEVTQPFLDEGNVNVAIEQDSRAYACIADFVPRNNLQEHSDKTDGLINFVYTNMLNTEERESAYKEFLKYLKSGEIPGNGCDIILEKLPN